MAFKGFRATANATQSYTSGAWGVKIYGNEEFDTDSGFNTSTGEFTVPVALNGLYGVFEAGFRGTAAPDSAVEIEYSTNGGSSWTTAATARNDPIITLAHTIVLGPVLLTTGHIYRVRQIQNATSNAANDPRNFFGLSVLDAGTFSGFRATKTSTQALTAGTLTEVQFTNEVFDTEAAYDATSRFTVPASWNGKWARFTAGIYLDGPGTLMSAFLQYSTDGGANWTSFAAQGQEAPVYFAGCQVSSQIRVSTGMLIRVVTRQSGSGRSVASGELVFFSGYLCGGL